MSTDTPIAPAVAEDTTSLSDHEQAFSKDAPPLVRSPESPVAGQDGGEESGGERDASGRFNKRHRAASQQAGPDDVAQIAEYTRRLREAEDAAGIERKPGESDRVYNLRRRAELAEARRDALSQPKAVPPPPKPAQVPRPSTTAFTDAEPTLEQFNSSEDPYRDYLRALTAYDRKKEAFEARQAQEKQQATTVQQQRDEQFTKWIKERDDEHVARLDAYVKAHPEFVQKLESAADLNLTPVMYAAVHLHPRGPEMMAVYVDHPDVADELFLLTEGKALGDDPLSNPLVAIAQRRLLQRVQAAQTGSAAAPRQATVAPRPPNPVRTAPQTPSDALPDDGSSLASHEKVWGNSRARRR